MKKILLTGGSGYIGSHTLLELAKTGSYELAVFDNFKNGHVQAIKIIETETNSQIKVYKGDLLNKAEINSALSEFTPDAVIHFAALIEAGVSVVHPTKFYENNVVGSLNLIQAMQSAEVKKIVFSSTAAVYGTPENPEVTESTPLNPESAYGQSKLMVENILRDLSSQEVDVSEKVDSIILRYFNAAGANPDMLIGQDYPKPTHLMTVAIEQALGLRDNFQIYGNDYPTKDGTCIRDYIHVQDLAKAHVKALEKIFSEFEGSNVFNIGTNEGYSNLDVVNELEKIHGKFNWSFGEKRPGDPVAFYANNSKAKEILNWTPEFGLAEILQHAYQWKKNFPNGFASKEVI